MHAFIPAKGRSQKSALFGVRRNGITSRMFPMPDTSCTKRSNPSPKPACGTVSKRRYPDTTSALWRALLSYLYRRDQRQWTAHRVRELDAGIRTGAPAAPTTPSARLNFKTRCLTVGRPAAEGADSSGDSRLPAPRRARSSPSSRAVPSPR